MNPDPRKSRQDLPGKGLLGWLGRQIGHVRGALKADVARAPKTIYRDCKVEEKPLPRDPNVKLRRTVIDEVIVQKKSPAAEIAMNAQPRMYMRGYLEFPVDVSRLIP